MADHTAFFYGTLMAPGVLYRVIYGTHNPEEWQRQLTTVKPALLSNFSRHRVKYADFPAIVPQQGTSVRGTYVTGLTDGDIYRLDIFEGEMYDRQKVKVKVLRQEIGLDGAVDESRLDDVVTEELEADTYVWRVDRSDLEEEAWDFEAFKKEKMYAWMGVAGHQKEGVEVDDGFADVDKAVAEEENELHENGRRDNGLRDDPSGGRISGKIAQDLAISGV